MFDILIVVYLVIAIALVGLILIQQGKGADMGASFGAGASATLFGSSGSGNFLTKTTTILAILFFGISILLGSMTANSVKQESEWNDLSAPAVEEVKQAAPADSDVPVSNETKDVPASDVPAN
jgi:preprotein translocase subunit SecG